MARAKMENMRSGDGVCPSKKKGLLFVVPEHLEEDKGGDDRGADGLEGLGFCVKSENSLFTSPLRLQIGRISPACLWRM